MRATTRIDVSGALLVNPRVHEAEEHVMNVVAWALYVGMATASPILIKGDFADKTTCGAAAEQILRSTENHFIGQSGQYNKSAAYGLTALCIPVIK